MPGTTSTALPSFSDDQDQETDAAKWKRGDRCTLQRTKRFVVRSVRAATTFANLRMLWRHVQIELQNVDDLMITRELITFSCW